MALKTYSHLMPLKRMPSEYEIASSRLLYHPEKGFSLNTPVGNFYNQHNATLHLDFDWESFSDPKEQTYAAYTRAQALKENFVDQCLERMEQQQDYLQLLPAAWLHCIENILCPLLYPLHGFQMISAYMGQLAPSGKLVILSSFQTANDMRKVHRLAYLTSLIKKQCPAFGESSKEIWLSHAAWQPLRKLVETMLVTFDWDEIFVASQLVVRPQFDTLLFSVLGNTARQQNDYLLGEVLQSLYSDSQEQQGWSTALAKKVAAASTKNKNRLNSLSVKWTEISQEAIEVFLKHLDGMLAVSESDKQRLKKTVFVDNI